MTGKGSLIKGIAVGIALTIAGVAASFMVFSLVLIGIGVLQVVWILPGCLYYGRRGESETVKGILIAAGLCFLLNATCWTIIMSGKVRVGG